MLKPCVYKGVAHFPRCHIASGPFARYIPKAGRGLRQRQFESQKSGPLQSRAGICCCAAAPAAMATESISGKMKRLKEQGRYEQPHLIVGALPIRMLCPSSNPRKKTR